MKDYDEILSEKLNEKGLIHRYIVVGNPIPVIQSHIIQKNIKKRILGIFYNTKIIVAQITSEPESTRPEDKMTSNLTYNGLEIRAKDTETFLKLESVMTELEKDLGESITLSA